MKLDNAGYDEIMRGYEQIRKANLLEESRRLTEVYERIPEYKELDMSVPDISAAFASYLIGNKEKSLDELHEKLSAIKIKKRSLLAEYSFPENYLEKIYTCNKCRDTGYIDGARCDCFKEKINKLLYSQSNLQALIERNNFGVMRLDLQEGEDLENFLGAVNVCRRFVSSFKDKTNPGNILFFGTVGTGKSFLTVSTAKELLDDGYTVLYFSAVDFFERLSDAVFRSESTDERKGFYTDTVGCDLLIIDDLGTEQTNSFVSTQLFNCINERDLRHKSTLISTNLDLKELRARYSDRIFSRLASLYTLCKLTGHDARIALRNMEAVAESGETVPA